MVFGMRMRLRLGRSFAFRNALTECHWLRLTQGLRSYKLKTMEIRGYFDHNATTPLCPEARDAWVDAVDASWLNPSSPYRLAAKVRVRLEAAREQLAAFFGCEPERVVFNSGATEANNAVFAHWATVLAADAKIGVSPTEHPSVIEAAKLHFKDRIVWLELDEVGSVDLVALVSLVESGELAAVSVMAANNETGVVNSWREIATVCSARGVEYHCDASQWVGKLPLAGFGLCDYVTACAHKFGGPRGVGFLLVPKGGSLRSLQGGVQEKSRRAGTEDVAGVLAMVAALEAAPIRTASAELRDGFESALCELLPGVQCLGIGAERLWNTSAVLMHEFASERWIRGLEKQGFLLSSGSACSTGKEGPSHVLAAMGVEFTAIRRVLRMSSAHATTADDWAALLAAIKRVYEALKSEAQRSSSKVISI